MKREWFLVVTVVGVHAPEPTGSGVEVPGAVVVEIQRGVELLAGERGSCWAWSR